MTALLIKGVPEVADASERRHLAFVGIGDSEHGTSHRIEALRDDGYRGLQGRVPETGRFTVTRTIGGQSVLIDGAVVNGVPRIGTAYVP